MNGEARLPLACGQASRFLLLSISANRGWLASYRFHGFQPDVARPALPRKPAACAETDACVANAGQPGCAQLATPIIVSLLREKLKRNGGWPGLRLPRSIAMRKNAAAWTLRESRVSLLACAWG
jgi:hypothetical protein